MQRDLRAYLNDILEAGVAIQEAVSEQVEDTDGTNRLIRSTVEREFTLIGEALYVIAKRAPEIFEAIPEARQIVVFRNLLTHEYIKVSDRIV
jgi:uncharacterized protein with HEPN domain